MSHSVTASQQSVGEVLFGFCSLFFVLQVIHDIFLFSVLFSVARRFLREARNVHLLTVQSN